MPKGVRNKIKKFRAKIQVDEEKLFDADFSKLQNRVKLRRQQFCQEYVKDYNGAAAMRRMGYQSAHPWVHAAEWMKEAYTQYYLAKLIDTMDEKAIVSRNRVLHILVREANDVGPDSSGAARISAARSLAKILGMEITKVEGNLTLNGGVMAVPMARTAAEWEANSKEAQKDLKRRVRE